MRALAGAEFSVFGVRKESGGICFVTVPAQSPADRAGLRSNDLLQGVGERRIVPLADLPAPDSLVAGTTLLVIRDQARFASRFLDPVLQL